MLNFSFLKGFRVLAYHSVPNKAITSIDVSKDELDKQFKHISESIYEVVSLREIELKRNDLNYRIDNKIVLTFDDGYDDFLSNVIPLLVKYNFPATVYPISHFVEYNEAQFEFKSGANKRSMNEAELQIAASCPLVNIGSHTVNHCNLGVVSEEVALKELEDSISYLSNLTKQPIKDFCYPWAVYNSSNKSIIERNFSTAVVGRGGVNKRNCNIHELRRIPIKNGTLKDFIKTLKLYTLPKDTLRHYKNYFKL